MRHNILVDAAPKSGSSHIKLTLQRLLGYRSMFISNDNVINASSAQIVLGSFDGQIAHHHIIPSPCNAFIMNRYSDELKVVVTQRNLLDVIVSLKNYLESAKVKDAWDSRGVEARKKTMYRRMSNENSPIVAGDDWASLDDEVQYNWIIRNSVPWYLSFYVSWAASDVPHIEVWYEDFFKDQVDGVKRILDFCEIDPDKYDNDEIRMISDHKDGKFNKGRSGRGREVLTQEMIGIVYDQADSWGSRWGQKIREELLDG